MIFDEHDRAHKETRAVEIAGLAESLWCMNTLDLSYEQEHALGGAYDALARLCAELGEMFSTAGDNRAAIPTVGISTGTTTVEKHKGSTP